MSTEQKHLQLIFKYDDLKPSGEPLKAELPLEVAREALEGYIASSGYWVDEPPQVEGGLYKTISGEVIIDAHLTAQARFLCVSCCAPHVLQIETREDLIAVPEGHEAVRGDEGDVHGEGELELDPDVYTFKGPDLDLTPMLRELLVLEAPLHPRCEDVGAACEHTINAQESFEEASDAEVDPRFAPFLGIRDQLLKQLDEREARASEAPSTQASEPSKKPKG